MEHYLGDVQKIRVAKVFPRAKIYWASPACPDWSDAKGVKRTFDRTNQLALWGAPMTEEEAKATRSRALMEEVVTYLRACDAAGDPVLVGVVENVIQCRKWDQWHRWLGEIRALGYETRTIALNSMHALAPVSPRCPQSRDRLYVAYWHKSLARTPDFARWLRPIAWCPECETYVRCIQSFKKPGEDMGRYRSQYVYRCPHVRCRNRIVEPESLPAAAVIDWSNPGTPIGERTRPLKDKTLARIRAGMERYWEPLLTPTGGTWREDAKRLSEPMPTRTTRESDGLALPPSAVPHGVDPLLVQYYGNGRTLPASGPIGTLPTKERYGLATPQPGPIDIDIDQVLFRMLTIDEIQRAMAFAEDYRLLKYRKQDQARLLGNAVTPPAAEVLLSPLVEAITGVERESGWDAFARIALAA